MKIRDFIHAQSKAVDSNLPNELWRVYENYEIVGDGEFVYAPPPPSKPRELPAKEGFPSAQLWDGTMIDWGIREYYLPLALDGLFLEFAELVENGAYRRGGAR
jgi:hypothetical protein